MRLFEIAPDFSRSQAGVLMTILQHLDSKVPAGTTVPFERITALMNNAGQPFSYDIFKDLLEKNPNLGNVISKHSSDSITLGKPEQEEPAQGAADPEQRVDQMAKSATKDAM
jgi:hypothetical protein